MSIKIVADSSCDLTEKMKKDLNISLVPFTIRIEDKEYRDDEDFKLNEFLQHMKKSSETPKTSCPATQDFINAYKGEEDTIFAVTISSKLSGTHNNAVLSAKLFAEDVKDKFIHVFDSCSASIAETLIALKINELSKLNYNRNEIMEKVNSYIKEMKTIFLLETLENLIKAGRINKFVGQIATALSIKPIMGATDEGEIKLVEKVRGSKKAFKRLVEVIGEQGGNLQDKILGISHCNAIERALELKKEVQEKYNFKDIIIVETAGLSSAYAAEGGIIIAF